MDLFFMETVLISLALAAASFKAVLIMIEELIEDRDRYNLL